MKWIRCPDCGDSKKNSSKRHCCIYDDGGSYCHRCGASHKVSFETLLQVILDSDEPLDIDNEWLEVHHERTESDRFTMLQGYKTDGLEQYTSFQMRSASGTTRG